MYTNIGVQKSPQILGPGGDSALSQLFLEVNEARRASPLIRLLDFSPYLVVFFLPGGGGLIGHPTDCSKTSQKKERKDNDASCLLLNMRHVSSTTYCYCSPLLHTEERGRRWKHGVGGGGGDLL